MLPQDPLILLSLVNTALRDQFPSLEDFCAHHQLSPEELTARLEAVGFHYDPAQNQFR
ncbi:MAG: DUF4250 domain-containing protein [Clostridiales bacterium]|nr:DUF4250 domain-containing protein [Clostridiales bacterium]